MARVLSLDRARKGWMLAVVISYVLAVVALARAGADLIITGMNGAIGAKTVTYDFERLMEGAKLLKCSEFGSAIVEHVA